MTRQKNLKALIRARMARTGESYTTARRHITTPSTPASSTRGVHPDTAALANVFAAHGHSHDEALLFVLGGGAGFLSMVFEYAGHPPMYTAVMRRWSMSNVFGQRVVERAGVGATIQQTGGAKTAARHLDAALESGQPCICVADIAVLPWHGLPGMWKGAAPQLVGVHGRDGDALDVDDHGRRRIDPERFAEARAAHRKSKHALFRLEATLDEDALQTGLRAGLRDYAEGMLDPQMGHFRNAFGIRGIRALAEQLRDTRTRKGLPQRFDAHRARLLGRLYESVRQDWSGPGGLRGLHADGLGQAQTRLGIALPVECVREAGIAWEAFATAAVQGDPQLEALRAAIDARVDGLWSGLGTDAILERRATVDAAMRADLGWETARWHAHLAQLADRLDALIGLEERAALEVRAAL
jgi:hypothetical protein